MKRYLIAHDLGTSGNKASLVDLEGNILRSYTKEYPMECPRPGWAQQNPQLWWEAVCICTKQILGEIPPCQVAGVCVTGQMMCCLPIGKEGIPLYPGLIWADGRAEEAATRLQQKFGADRFYQITGMRCSPNYGLPKMMWLKQNKPEIYCSTDKFLSPKDYINFMLTGIAAIDPENAAFWQCYDWKKRSWSAPLLNAAEISTNKLPDVLDISAIIGYVRPEIASQCGLALGTPVIMASGDGGTATLGAAVLEPGDAYISLGTSSWVCVVSGKQTLDPQQRIAKLAYLNTWRDSGTMQAGGYAYRWMEETFCQSERSLGIAEGKSWNELVDDLASTTPPGADGLLFQPYLLGERSPLWDMQLRAAFIGLTSSTTKAHICRSVMEGVALHLRWIYQCILETNRLSKSKSIKLVGGGGKSFVWRQIFADVFGVPIEIVSRPDQAGALGCAVTAGVALGVYRNYSDIRRFQSVESIVEPNFSRYKLYQEMLGILVDSAAALQPIHHRLGKLSLNSDNC